MITYIIGIIGGLALAIGFGFFIAVKWLQNPTISAISHQVPKMC